MPADDAALGAAGPGLVRTPDQLQQSRRPEPPRPGPLKMPRDRDRGAEPRHEGVLGQLRTERAHD